MRRGHSFMQSLTVRQIAERIRRPHEDITTVAMIKYGRHRANTVSIKRRSCALEGKSRPAAVSKPASKSPTSGPGAAPWKRPAA
jgi:hypothetical protein